MEEEDFYCDSCGCTFPNDRGGIWLPDGNEEDGYSDIWLCPGCADAYQQRCEAEVEAEIIEANRTGREMPF